jgi:hypothetical protein
MSIKRVVQVLSLVGIAAALFQILSVTTPRPVEAEAQERSKATAFARFPEGQTRRIDFQADDSAFAGLTALESQQQMRDWLLFSVVSDAGLGPKEIREVLFELPPIRRGYLEPVSNYEYGETRSRSIDGDQVIALIQKGTPEEEAEQLAHVADEQRKNLGKVPGSFLVFEYELRPEEKAGWITRRATVKGQELFTEAAGYRQANVTSAADLETFLAQVDDLTFVSLEGSGLTLGGRRLRGRIPRNLRVEDVAALYQSEEAVRKTRREREEFNARWDRKTYSTETEKALLESQYEQERKELEEKSGSLAEGSGFSLDPIFDYERLSELFQRISPKLEELAAKEGDQSPISASEIQAAGEALKEHKEAPFLELAYKMSQSQSLEMVVTSKLLEGVQERLRFQAARYDGKLQGTEVGMVLFYTDLLAKLWALDYMGSAPRPEEVADFVPLLKVPVTPIYLREEAELPGTRLWFGPRDQGFQMVNSGPGMLFARNATRIYAASSNPLKPGEEAEPNASSAAFLGWWNNHYERVARFEPQYQRLNEVMKWSLLVSWLGDQSHMERLSFLTDWKVDHSQWFPEWVRRQPDLQFRLWDAVKFYNPHAATTFKAVQTEAMPILYSKSNEQPGGSFTLSGGVSLGSEKVFETRIALPEEVPSLLKRSYFDYRSVEGLEEGIFRLKTLEQAELEFGQILGDSASVVAKARPAAKLRSSDLEIRNAPFEVEYRATPAGLHIDARAGATEIGRLSVSPTKNGFKVGFESLDLEQGGKLARQVIDGVLDGRDPLQVIASEPRVAAVLHESAGDGYFVRLKGADRWLRLAPEGEPSVAIGEEVQMRVGGWRAGSEEAPRWTAAWVEEGTPPLQLQDGGYVVVEPPASSGGGAVMEVANKGPPPGAGSVELPFGDVRVRALRDARGRYYFEGKALPESLRKDPSRLTELIGGKPAADLDNSLARLRRGSYDAVGHDLAKDPVLFKKSLLQYKADKFLEADQLAAAGRHEETARILDSLAETFGPDPDLSLRQALAQLGKGRAANAVDTLDDALARIDARLAQAKMPAAEREALFRMRRGLEMQEAILGNPALRMETRFGLDPHGKIDFYGVLLDSVKGKKVPLQEIRSSHVYVDAGIDAPEVHNIDWSPPLQGKIDEAVSRQLDVTEFSSWEIAHAQPGALREAASGHQFRLGSPAAKALEHSLRQEPCSGDADRQQRPECDPYVYLITMRPGAAAVGTTAGR